MRHRFTTLFSTPIVGRIRFGLSARVQSGAPFDITTGKDDNGDTISNDRPVGVTRYLTRVDGTQVGAQAIAEAMACATERAHTARQSADQSVRSAPPPEQTRPQQRLTQLAEAVVR